MLTSHSLAWPTYFTDCFAEEPFSGKFSSFKVIGFASPSGGIGKIRDARQHGYPQGAFILVLLIACCCSLSFQERVFPHLKGRKKQTNKKTMENNINFAIGASSSSNSFYSIDPNTKRLLIPSGSCLCDSVFENLLEIQLQCTCCGMCRCLSQCLSLLCILLTDQCVAAHSVCVCVCVQPVPNAELPRAAGCTLLTSCNHVSCKENLASSPGRTETLICVTERSAWE